MTFFGPGSEWFWGAVSSLAVAVSLIVVVLQLRAQRSAALYEQTEAWNRDWDSEELLVSRINALIEYENQRVEDGVPDAFYPVGNFFDRLGYLLVHGNLQVDVVWNDFRTQAGRWWVLMEPFIREDRKIGDDPRLLEYFEKLERLMREMDRKKLGKERTFEVSPEATRQGINVNLARLQLKIDTRNGVLPTVPARPSADALASGVPATSPEPPSVSDGNPR